MFLGDEDSIGGGVSHHQLDHREVALRALND